MVRWSSSRVLWSILLLVCWPNAGGETFKAPDPGPGMVPIAGAWQFHTGDDLAWADPAFDDSGWEAIGANQGWGAQRHLGYTGYAWYRKRIEIGASDQPLGIYISASYGAYEVYWNGKRLGSTGRLPPNALWYTFGQNASFPLPSSGPVSGLIALRFWRPALSTNDDPAEGGFRRAPQLGRLPLLQQQMQFIAFRNEHRQLFLIVPSVLLGTGAVLSLVVFFLRRRREWLYLWLSLLLGASTASNMPILLAGIVTYVVYQLLVQLTAAGTDVGLWLTLLWIFGLQRIRRWRVIAAVVIAVYLGAQLVDTITIFFWQHAGAGFVLTDRIATQIYAPLEFFPLCLAVFGLARRRTASLIAVGVIAALYGAWPPVLSFMDLVSPAVGLRMANWALHLGEYRFDLFTVLSWLLVLTLGVAIVLRQLTESRRQAHLEQELLSAQEIQHILIPEEIPSVPGMAVASVYKPATEVGGDFFQVIPPETAGADTGTLIVAGDVSGKGLRAAMTVSLVVGALRTLAESDNSPAAILAGLNRRLIGRTQGGFVTCCAVLIDANGRATMANAGHCQPYLDGHEVDLPNGLPLGLVADVEYEEVSFHVSHGQQLTFLSDGVVEARNSDGELYGFDRLNELMQERPSAERIADTAISFGQDDDITVLTVTRLANA